MATNVPTKHSSGSCTARDSLALRPARLSIREHLPIFAEAIPCKGMESDRDLLGSGSPSAGLIEESQKDREHAQHRLIGDLHDYVTSGWTCPLMVSRTILLH